MSNGFGNRFLWILARRQKLVALPSPMPDDAVAAMQSIVINRVEAAKNLQGVSMSNEASHLWVESYPDLTMDCSGAAGSLVNRTEAHAIRLSLIYALASGHSQIEVPDLKAALAVVEYSRQSAFYIFGSTGTDRRKSKILKALKNAENHEMTVTEISNEVFKRHVKSNDLHKMLTEMEASKLVHLEKTSTLGAPKTIVKLSICA
jgi:predicted transcriptional regulator